MRAVSCACVGDRLAARCCNLETVMRLVFSSTYRNEVLITSVALPLAHAHTHTRAGPGACSTVKYSVYTVLHYVVYSQVDYTLPAQLSVEYNRSQACIRHQRTSTISCVESGPPAMGTCTTMRCLPLAIFCTTPCWPHVMMVAEYASLQAPTCCKLHVSIAFH